MTPATVDQTLFLNSVEKPLKLMNMQPPILLPILLDIEQIAIRIALYSSANSARASSPAVWVEIYYLAIWNGVFSGFPDD